MNEQEHPITLTDLPLNQFTVGQKLLVTFQISGGHTIWCDAEFLGIERGNVKVKMTNVHAPSWFSYKYDLARKYPNYIGKFRAVNCKLWGKSKNDYYNRCHWFKDIKTPAS